MTLDAVSGRDMSAFLRPLDHGRRGLDLLVTGARCAGCISKIERELSAMPGVEAARLNLSTGRLAVTLAGREAQAGRVVAAVERLGYGVTPFDPAAGRKQVDREGRRLLIALGVAGFGAMNAMMFSVPLWAGLFGQELGPATRSLMMWLSAIVGAPCALFAGMTFFQSAWRSLKAGRANMDVPISIGVILTLVISFIESFLGGRDAYFDAAVSLLFLLLIGRYLDHVLRARARGAAGDLLALQARAAQRLNADGQEATIPVSDIVPGDLLRVRPGERIPVDAVVMEGRSTLDASLLTGESAPQALVEGDLCRAGAVNLTGLLTLRAEARSEDSALAAIARLVEAGTQSRSAYVRWADKAAAIYVPVVHSLAAATFLGGLAFGLGPREALIRAAALLIITCPCALGLAVPAVLVAASGRLFRNGVLVKSGAALERLAQVDHVVFDKTGVLTEGRPGLVGGHAMLAQAAPLARASSHPLAKALARAAGPGVIAASAVETAGQGVSGLVDGRPARLGRATFVGAPEADHAETELWFGFDDGPKTRFVFSDVIRPDAAATVAALKAMGLPVEMLSGDREGPVRRIAAEAGIDQFRAGQTPQDKAAVIDRLKAEGRRVLMVGDGLNDAAALARAHAAIAPGTALEASQNAADLVLTGEALFPVVDAVRTARSARGRVRENFGFAAVYNLFAAPAAMLGLVNPFIAAIAMSVSSLMVTLNALRLWMRR